MVNYSSNVHLNSYKKKFKYFYVSYELFSGIGIPVVTLYTTLTLRNI